MGASRRHLTRRRSTPARSRSRHPISSPCWTTRLPGGNSVITIVDPASRSVVGQVTAGYSPWVRLRPSANQLLVSQVLGPQREGPALLVFDLSDLASPPVVIPLPERAGYHVNNPSSMQLSGNERFLFHQEVATRCPGRGPCDYSRFAVIDLDAGLQVATAVMETTCGVLTPMTVDSVLAACGYPVSTLHEISSDGSTREMGTLPARDAGILAIGITGSGEPHAVYMDGAVVTTQGALPLVDLLPPGQQAGFNTATRVPGDRLLFAFGEGEPPYSGLAVVDARDPATFQTFTLPVPARHVGVLDHQRALLLAEDGATLVVLDLATGQVAPATVTLPQMGRWLVGY